MLTDLIFPTRAFVVPFVCVMDWPGYFGEGDVTTWEEKRVPIDDRNDQWAAALPSRTRRLEDNRFQT